MTVVLEIVVMLIDLYWWVVIASVVLSWLLAFGVVNSSHQFVRSLWQLFYAFTEPLLAPIRRVLPNTGAIDISPLILLIGLSILRHVILSVAVSMRLG